MDGKWLIFWAIILVWVIYATDLQAQDRMVKCHKWNGGDVQYFPERCPAGWGKVYE